MLTASRLRIIVLGYIVRGPLGGLAWHYLQYVLGLARLGHDVYFFEDSDGHASCYDPVRNAMGTDPSYGLEFAARAFARLGLAERWTYYDAHRAIWCGPAASRALDLCKGADVLLDLSCVNPLRSWLDRIPARALVDTDPVFTQIRHLNDPEARRKAACYNAFFSYGENIGQPGCTVPADGFRWRPTRQPVVMDAWTRTNGPANGPLSTIMLWNSYPAAHHNGTRFGMKSDSFDPYLDLPQRSSDTFHIAVGSKGDPRERLASLGWTVLDPREPTKDPWSYQDFIRDSRGEFSVAKHGYVVSQSGWFSERSAAYLASGRPVVVQDTGFTRWLRSEGGVLPFSSRDEALLRLEELRDSYERRCEAARATAEEYFEASRVLTRLLDAAI